MRVTGGRYELGSLCLFTSKGILIPFLIYHFFPWPANGEITGVTHTQSQQIILMFQVPQHEDQWGQDRKGKGKLARRCGSHTKSVHVQLDPR